MFDISKEQARNKVSMKLSMLFWCTYFSEGFVCIIFTEVTSIKSGAPRHVVFQKGLTFIKSSICWIKKFKKISRDLSFNFMNNWIDLPEQIDY